VDGGGGGGAKSEYVVVWRRGIFINGPRKRPCPGILPNNRRTFSLIYLFFVILDPLYIGNDEIRLVRSKEKHA
jgi:hypothetical protein